MSSRAMFSLLRCPPLIDLFKGLPTTKSLISKMFGFLIGNETRELEKDTNKQGAQR